MVQLGNERHDSYYTLDCYIDKLGNPLRLLCEQHACGSADRQMQAGDASLASTLAPGGGAMSCMLLMHLMPPRAACWGRRLHT